MPKKPRKATDEDLPKKLNIELINKNKVYLTYDHRCFPTS